MKLSFYLLEINPLSMCSRRGGTLNSLNMYRRIHWYQNWEIWRWNLQAQTATLMTEWKCHWKCILKRFFRNRENLQKVTKHITFLEATMANVGKISSLIITGPPVQLAARRRRWVSGWAVSAAAWPSTPTDQGSVKFFTVESDGICTHRIILWSGIRMQHKWAGSMRFTLTCQKTKDRWNVRFIQERPCIFPVNGFMQLWIWMNIQFLFPLSPLNEK